MIDVIVAWPRNCDYPLWRQFIRDGRERFRKVYVVFTEHDGADYRAFVAANFPEAECFDSPPRGDHDWRDVAVNAGLDRSTAPWVWFTEQDFIIRPGFWEQVAGLVSHDAIGWHEGAEERWHPSCLFVRRSAIDATDRYFGPVPVDHFTLFGRQLRDVAEITGSFEHLQGTSQNHWLIDTGEDAGVFRRERFRAYLRDSLAVTVPIHPEWRRRALAEIG